tara:strand:+ start:1096 stop:1611 length:516 start_codon:yes stop_codon:yes gene_type:complete
MGLIQVATSTVTSGVANVDLVGITSDDVYMIVVSDVRVASDNDVRVRITKSSDSSADTTSNYDNARLTLRSDTTFGKSADTNADYWNIFEFLGNDVSEAGNMIIYCYNFNSSSEFSFVTMENVAVDNANPTLKGKQGGAVHTVAQSNNGLRWYHASGANITSGTFTLYKVV